MSILYFDCFSGVSGDMLIASLLDCGVPFDFLKKNLSLLDVDVDINTNKQVINGINCTCFQVNSSKVPPIRHLPHIIKLIENSTFSQAIKDKSIAVFQNIARAEASVHGVDINSIHFHEIGAVDTIIDVVGFFLCLDYLKIDQIYSSPIPWSTGFVNISHGKFPVPAPATALLLKGIPCKGSPVEMELVTPTGAALITSVSTHFGILPPCIPLAIGYGAGTRTRDDGVPNLLRVINAEPFNSESNGDISDLVGVLETTVDDLSPEIFTYLYKLIFSDTDVLDFFTTPVHMKKNRPGFLITILVHPQAIQRLTSLLIQQTSTLGVRFHLEYRLKVKRHQELLETPWGQISIKIATLPSGKLRIKPEYEDCQTIATANDIPLVDVISTVNSIIAKKYT